ITWKASKYPWPKMIWFYQAKPAMFSSGIVSNLLSLCSFTTNDIDRPYSNGNVLNFSKSGRNLRISFSESEIDYFSPMTYGLNHLATNVPNTNQLVTLARNLLPKIGISLSELTKLKNGQPRFFFDTNEEIGTTYFLTNGTTLHNIDQRSIMFGRFLNGIRIKGIGGNGRIQYGDNNRLVQMSIQWCRMERRKSHPTATYKQILQWLHDGRCYFPRWFYPPYQDKIDIDWTKVKHLTITDAKAYYWNPPLPERGIPMHIYTYPFAILSATVDTGATNLNIEIDCPIIDEAKPLKTHP
ncbi:MAG: hypothetical protein ACREDS_08145, partial [Limisphaerales bacterium]